MGKCSGYLGGTVISMSLWEEWAWNVRGKQGWKEEWKLEW